MSLSMIAAQHVDTYCRAKDSNRPHLMASVFADDAWLEMATDSALLFPHSVSQGREAIVQALVRHFGRYDWRFRPEPPHRVQGLKITIAVMKVLPATAVTPVTECLAGLPYPWCPAAAAAATAPDLPALRAVLEHLRRHEPLAGRMPPVALPQPELRRPPAASRPPLVAT
ncbi:MAG TPA: nuclear transport factor 2 family protein [Ramlibacter sp.]|nr:nuclear transport factor 2 family protein [Ramlibacter sp.]